MNLDAIEKLLKSTMGLDVASIGSFAVQKAIAARLSALGVNDVPDYIERASKSRDELQTLIESVVVPETWFYRDPAAFVSVVRFAEHDWQPRSRRAPLRLLSVPCSSGEEPYSLAMSLLDVGLPEGELAIDAIDISERALAKAARAVYRKNSFRGTDLAFRDRHFKKTDEGYEISERVRRLVRFRRGNLVDAGFLADTPQYDCIFCRNVLIYFDRTVQDSVVRTLNRLLRSDGMLFVGPSETALLLEHGFVSNNAPLSFGFRRAKVHHRRTSSGPISMGRALRRAQNAARLVGARRPRLRFASLPPVPALRAPARISFKPAAPSRRPTSHSLERAQLLADQGHLAEAARCCEAYLEQHGPEAQGYYLLGLMRDAAGSHVEAVQLYRKALYLQPKHQQALIHLQLLLQKQGDSAGAKLVAERADRLRRKAGT